MTENISIEIDFLPVGEGSRCGDAIAFRYGLFENGKWQNQTIFIIDGGNSDSGDALVKHVKEVYKSNYIDRVILTHPDCDHASGLRNVIDELGIGKIWMHRPWKYWSDLKDAIVDNRVTKKSFGDRLREAYQYAHDIEQKAIEKKIKIFHPHQGNYFAVYEEKILTILGPGKDLYLDLIKASDKNPHLEANESISKSITSGKKKLVYEDTTFATEHLAEKDEITKEENDMSLILLLTVAGKKFLFTGDAGTRGLFNAITYSTSNSISLRDLSFFDVPHHGSRHNLSKGILKYINADFAIISCSKNGEPNHPNNIVINSLLRRNMKSYCTKGEILNYHFGAVPIRDNYHSATPIPFSNQVEIPIEV
jgi:beta-lactamase superfamily II metal-dependent hydrolase